MPPRALIPEFSLVGSWRETPWPPGEVMEAKCRAYSPTKGICEYGPLLQSDYCKCGLHLFYSMEDARSYTVTSSSFGHVIGIAAGGGRVLFDNKFCRAEQAEVVCIIDPREYAPQTHRSGNSETGFTEYDLTEEVRGWAKKVARRYRVPMLGLFDAMGHAGELGEWVYMPRRKPDGGYYIEGVDT